MPPSILSKCWVKDWWLGVSLHLNIVLSAVLVKLAQRETVCAVLCHYLKLAQHQFSSLFLLM
jgi:hypothetical protein